jgi:DNA primase small subunit
MDAITPLEYYTCHFPYKELARVLTRNGDALCQREFALEGDFYKRYVVAKDWEDLRRQVIAHPGITSLHVGPVYSGRVARSADHARSWPARRELVFDIDLFPDYEWLTLNRADGSTDMEACDRAWPVCAIGAFLLQYVLEHAFGFREIVCVYSGRRGVHLWVCDNAAMGLADDARGAIVGYVRASLTEDKMRATAALRCFAETNQLLPAVRWAFDELFVREMGLLDPLEQRLSLVDRLDLSQVEGLQGLHEDVLDVDSGVAAWARVQLKVRDTGQQWIQAKLDEVVLAYVWPRIDENVSLHRNHLLKACFVAHPKTGRIASPVDQADLFSFRPAAAPRLSAWSGEAPPACEPRALPRALPRARALSHAPALPRARPRAAARAGGKGTRRKSPNRPAGRKRSPLAPQGAAMDVEDLGRALASPA